MTISSTTRKAGPYSGTGAQTAFPFAFKVFATSDVLVTVTDATGVDSTLTSGYSVALNADQDASPGGTVTFTTAPAVGTLVTLGSVVAATQGTSIPNQGGFFPKVIEQALDKLTVIAQQLAGSISRSLKFPFSDTASGDLPSATARANNLLGFDSSGRPVAVAPAAQSATALQSLLALISGSSLIGFIQSGAGAIARLVQDELRERVSITQFGAKCDGVTDDTTAVAAAQAAAAGRALVFPGVTNIATALTITVPIVDTNAQIFKVGSQVKINNGRPVRPEWWGAKGDGVTECLSAIAAALTAAVDCPVTLGSVSPGYRTSGTITLSGDLTNGRQKLRGAGANATSILYYGTGSAIQSNPGLADYCEASGFSLVNMATLGSQIGLDIGTARNGKFRDILVKNFLIGADLRKNDDAVGDYYNSVENIVVDCGAAPAGSIGFQLGNNLPGHTNPTCNANDLFDCRSYGCETGIWINGSGNTIHGHKIVSCKTQLRLINNSYDNYIEAYCESQTGVDSMGSADAGTVGNTLRLFNDALNLHPFTDNGWNNIIGNVQAGGLGYPAPARVLDCELTDHINVQGKNAASIPVFSIKLPDRDGAIRVVTTLAGYTFTVSTYAGIQQWSAYKKASGTPVFNLDSTLSDNLFTVTAAADGTLTWSIAGSATSGIFTTVQITVRVQGVCADTNGLGLKIIYQRLV